ncbi:MAG TPA: energy transducer TonB [Croceibacterium sp.]|nr:energy transducer TonB [Croceibacterium sp.]
MPATDPGTWVRPEDYPAWAVAYDVEGRVGVKLDVSANGRVTSCEVTRSSGVADLDRIACEKVTERGRFVPARDEDGDPVAGTWASGVVWQVPDDDDHAAPMPGFLVVSMVVEPDGAVSDCRVERARAKRRNSRRTSAATAASSRFSMRRAIRNASAFGS